MLNRSYIIGHETHPHFFSNSKIFSLQKKTKLSDQERELVIIIRQLSDPTKLKIYLLLCKVPEIPVTDISLILNLSQSATSHALSDLRNIGLIESHRCGQLICYSLKLQKKKNKLLGFFERFKNG